MYRRDQAKGHTIGTGISLKTARRSPQQKDQALPLILLAALIGRNARIMNQQLFRLMP